MKTHLTALAAMALALVFTTASQAGSITLSGTFDAAGSSGDWQFDAAWDNAAMADWNITLAEATIWKWTVTAGTAGSVTGAQSPNISGTTYTLLDEIDNLDPNLSGLALTQAGTFANFYTRTPGGFNPGQFVFSQDLGAGAFRELGVNGSATFNETFRDPGLGAGIANRSSTFTASFGDPASHPVVPLPAAAWMAVPMLGGLGITQLVRRRRLAA